MYYDRKIIKKRKRERIRNLTVWPLTSVICSGEDEQDSIPKSSLSKWRTFTFADDPSSVQSAIVLGWPLS